MVQVAGDHDSTASVRAKAARKREHFKEGLAARDLLDARVVDGSEDGDGLAVELGDGGDNFRILDVAHEALSNLALQFLDGETRGVDAAGERHVEVAVEIDTKGFVGEFVGKVGDGEGELIVGAEDVAGVRARGGACGIGSRGLG